MPALACTLAIASGAAAAPGDLDGAFGTAGVFAAEAETGSFGFARYAQIALDSQGRPIVVFQAIDDGDPTKRRIGVMRLTTGGALDPTFNPTGPTPGLLITGFAHPVCLDGTQNGPFFRGMALTSDDRIVIVANVCSGFGAFLAAVMRLDAAGGYDMDFNGSGRVFFEGYPSLATSVEVDASDRVYIGGVHCVGGTPTTNNCFFRNAIVRRLTTAGASDPTYNAGGATPGLTEVVIPDVSTELFAIDVTDDGRVVAVGQHIEQAQDVPKTEINDAFVARFSSAGELDESFGPNGTTPGVVETDLAKAPDPVFGPQAILFAATLVADDAVVVAGNTYEASGAECAVAKFTAAGALDASFASEAAAPGITPLPDADCRAELLTQADGKIVLIGADTEGFVLARFTTDGRLDDGFGGDGIVTTPFSGPSAEPFDGVLQGDGKIVVAGVRAEPSSLPNPVAVRYLVAEGPAATPTATGGASDPTPTPTATPVDQPGELCDNGVDDESDGYRDRADPECPPRADGGGQGLATEAARKAIAKCGKAVQAAGAKLGAAKLKRLQQCVGGVFDCVQVKPADAQCLPKATSACAKQLGSLTKERTKLADAIGKACDVPALVLGDLTGASGLGYGFESAPCQERGVPALASVADVAACVRARVECAAERLLAMEAPRGAELLAAGGRDPALDAPCLAGPGSPGGGLAAAVRAKIAAKCQRAVFKVGGKFAGAKTKVVNACLQAAVACVQLKPTDPECLTKMRATCAKKIAGLTGEGGIETKVAAAVAKDCGALAAAELTAAEGLGFTARAVECGAFGAPPLQSAAAVGDCLRRQHERRVEQMLEATTPRMQELLNLGQVTLP